MRFGIVIGNGESRKYVDLHQLPSPIYGCNALYRDFTPELLVSTDKPMIKEISDSDYLGNWVYRDTLTFSSNFGEAFLDYGFSSGPTALYFMTIREKVDVIFLLGFDFYSHTNRINNLYKSTNAYLNSDHNAVDSNQWVREIAEVKDKSQFIKFVFVNDDFKLPDLLKDKCEQISYDKFYQYLNINMTGY